jgi:hypothetical protein
MNNRFYVAAEKLHEIAAQLIDNGFEELDPCTSEDELSKKVFIDTVKKTFYFLDDVCLKETNLIILDKYKCSYKTTNIKAVKQWK